MNEWLTKPLFITGASSGIGFALARQLIGAGAKSMVISGRDQDKLATAEKALSTTGVTELHTVVMDQGQLASVAEALATLRRHTFEPLTLVCNVGVNPVHKDGVKKVHSTEYQQFVDTVSTNVAHAFYLIQSCLPAMRSAGVGRIYLMGSQAYRHGIPGQISYNVSKSALVGLAHTINQEYGQRNIVCRLFNIGMVQNQRTERLRKRLRGAPDVSLLTEGEVAQCLVQHMLAPFSVVEDEAEIDIV